MHGGLGLNLLLLILAIVCHTLTYLATLWECLVVGYRLHQLAQQKSPSPPAAGAINIIA